MTARRTDIQRALDELIANEEGMRFQGLAVVLAKKRWPDLIACERKKDLGADAIAKAPFAAEGAGMVLACSITAKLAKIREDAAKVKVNFKNIEKIVFATPSAVSNELETQWAEEIKWDFGVDLAIMSREDIITSLRAPENASLLQTHLDIPVDMEPALSDLVEQVRMAAAELTASWCQRIAGKPLLELRALRLEPDGRDSADVLLLSHIRTRLLRGRRIVLEGPAGRGKTTTLTQLANTHAGAVGTPFLIDLTAWTSTRGGILQFIAGMPQFQRRSLDTTTLARVNTVEHFSFLLNGWNEIGEPEFPHAESALRTLERDFPTAGIIVATRTHHIVPPLPGATRARLLTLTRSERSSYINSRLGGRADELRLKVESDPALDELTRTPFFLSEVASIFEAGATIPSTRIGVLDAVARLVERSDHHRNYLQQAPLAGRASDYLGRLATRMTAQHAVSIVEEMARPAVAAVGNLLKEAGQITAVPDPGTALAALCAHHVLERQEYPEVAFRFEHQQFQEFYAAVAARKQLDALLATADEQRQLEFTKSYVNEPAWEEPLRLLADDIRGRSEAADRVCAIQAGTLLVTMALNVDPVFAAELAHLCGPQVWNEVRRAVGERLRSLYASPARRYGKCALAGMLASGSDDFKDVIEPLLSADAENGALATYRTWYALHLSSLGPGWRESVSGWKEAARVAFVSRLLRHRYVPEVTVFVLADPSMEIKLAAIERLSWIGAEEEVARFLTSLNQTDFDLIVERLDPGLIPVTLRDRAITVLQNCRTMESDPLVRLGTLLRLAQLGAPELAEQVKMDLASITGKIDSDRTYFVIKRTLDIVRATDEPWASAWVAEKVADGSLWHESWEKMITAVPGKLKQELLHRLETEDFEHVHYDNIIAVLTAARDVSIPHRVFAKLCELRRTIANAPNQRHEFEGAIERQLESLMRALPADISVAGVSSAFSRGVDGTELSVIARVFSRVARHDRDILKELCGTLRESLRDYLKRAVEIALQLDDFSGEMKADVGSVLASVGSPEDMQEMRRLIRADIDRIRRGRDARAQGDRGQLGNGGIMSYSNWHVQSVVRLDPVNSEAFLVELLNEPEYEQDVAKEFVKQVLPPPPAARAFQKVDYERIWEARAGRRAEPCKERQMRYAVALRLRIEELLEARCVTEHVRPVDFRLRMLAVALAKIDSHGSADLVFKVMSLADEWDNYSRVEAFEALLFSGVALPAHSSVALLDPCLVRWRKYGVQQDGWLLKRFLCLLPFVDDSAKGIERMRQSLSEFPLPSYELRDVLEALGHSRSDQALPFLLELGSRMRPADQFGDAWINAVAAIDTPEAHDVLVSFVDPGLPGFPPEVISSREDVLVARIADLARRSRALQERLFDLCDAELPSVRRGLLAKVVGRLGSLEAVSAGLNLIDDADSTPIPYEIWMQLEEAFVERRPCGESPNTSTLEPRSSNAVRAKLLAFAATDERRKKSASRILAQIEDWRLEYGRPSGEPRHPSIESRTQWPMTN